ncbi:hypothetical protein [Methylobacterium oxalidis]|uniref:Uncharacterized protein n=1 Tax=Methylobacterium oxalidis TaxID=944322 RepID=A0A512J4H7_9HYPH|nr:hypothetical protein [Methylobacterium oxalidis]GEP04861.1 hypothetical protein MOX02_28990 [Methylobacterium oxalidis]GJE30148.1 hypothetical protein LDDCCGHA_0311 [Methylobacterium oxalidis]GLS66992.1 hypothetical protein GCM10007888_53750 [Methylobacterium oxalidis]
MRPTQRLARILATRTGEEIELAIATAGGETLKVLATQEQIDMLVDELEDILNSPAEGAPGGPQDAA